MATKERLYASYEEKTRTIAGYSSLFEDVAASFELLEHLSCEGEIHRVSSRYAVLSLPDSTRAYRLDIQIPKLGELEILIPLPRLKAPKHVFNGEHYWEIGKAGYALRRVMGDMFKAGFRIIKTYRVFENPYHRFFVLEKTEEMADD